MSFEDQESERLSSIDRYGHKKNIIPAPVRGRFHRQRTWVQGVLIIFFLMLPWIQIRGEQAFLIDLVHGQFAIFGLRFFAHDTPMVFFVLSTAAFGLLWATAVWGRVWCGWACPQTVFVDGVFRRIEKWTEGDYIRRRRIAQGEPRSLTDWLRTGLKWFLFFIVSSVLAHSAIALFSGSKALLSMMGHSPTDNWFYFVLVSSITGVLLFDFGWFREQFCVIMCPYGRFQSVLMDSTSLAVIYDEKRGEPRKGTPAAKEKGAGDCVACNRCVQVCPTGIDIRQGVQMECIACTGCIDACDEIMEKVNKPKGLIRYGNVDGTSWKIKKPRALVYLGLLLATVTGLSWSVASRQEIHWNLLRGQGPVFREIKNPDGSLSYSNHLRVHLQNQTRQAIHRRIQAFAAGQPLDITSAENPFVASADEMKTVHLFVIFPSSLLGADGKVPIEVRLVDETNPQNFRSQNYQLVGPSHGP